MEQQEINKMLGLEGIDPVSGLNRGNPDSAIKAINDKNPNYRDTYSDFSQEHVYDSGDQNSVMFRASEQQYGYGQDVVQDEYDSQKGWARAAHGIGRLASSTVLKAAQGIAYLDAIDTQVLYGMFDGKDTKGTAVSRALDAPLVEMFENLEQGAKEAMPIFKPSNYGELNIFQKLNPLGQAGMSFYQDEVVDGLAFMFSNYIPGGALSKLGTGARLANVDMVYDLANAYNKARSGIKSTEFVAPNMQKIAQNIDAFTMGTLMTASEAMFEAHEAKKSILNNKELRMNYTDEQIEQLADQRAKDVFVLNMTILAPSNAFEVGTIFNKTSFFKKGTSELATRTNRYGVNIGADGVATAGKLGTKSNLANIGSNMAAEGLWEENIQYTIGKLGSYVDTNALEEDVLSKNTWDALKKLGSNLGTLVDYKDSERVESVALGAMLGGGSAAIGGIESVNKLAGGDGGISAYNRELREAQETIIKERNDPANDISANNLFAREEPTKVTLSKEEGKFLEKTHKKEGVETKEITEEQFNQIAEEKKLDKEKGGEYSIPGGYKNDSTGNPVMDTEVIESKLAVMKNLGELTELDNIIANHEERNPIARSMIKRSKLAEIAQGYFKAGMAEALLSKLDMMKTMTDEELKLGGFEKGKKDINLEIEQAKAFVRKLEDKYNSHNESIINRDKTKQGLENHKKRMSFLNNRAAVILSMDTAVESLNSQQQALEDQIKAISGEFEVSKQEDGTLNIKYEKDENTLPLARQITKIQEMRKNIAESRESIFNDYNLVRRPSGKEYFAKNRKELINKYNLEYEEKIDLSNEVTLEKYLKYELAKFKRLVFRKKIEMAQMKFNSEEWLTFLKDARTIEQAVTFAVNNDLLLDLPTQKLLTDLFGEANEAIQRLSSQIETKKDELFDAQFDQDFEAEKIIEEEILALEDRYKVLLAPFNASPELTGGELQVKIEDALNAIKDRYQNSIVSKGNEDSLRLTISEEFIKSAEGLIKNINLNPEYENLTEVERQLKILENLEKIFKQREDFDPKIINNFLEKLGETLAELKEIHSVVKKRVEDKQRREKITYKMYVTNLFNTLGFNAETGDTNNNLGVKIRQLVGEEYYAKWVDTLKKDLETQKDEEIKVPNEALIYALLENVNKEDIKDYLDNILKQEQYKILRDLVSKINYPNEKTKEHANKTIESVTEKMEGNILKEAVLLVEMLIEETSKMSDPSQFGFDSDYKSAVYQFLKHQDLFKLLNDAESQTRTGATVSKEELVVFANALATLYSTEQLELIMDSGISIEGLLGIEKAKSEALKTQFTKEGAVKEFVPSPSQRISIYQIIRSLLKPNENLQGENVNLEDHWFKNITYLKGPAGSGKSKIVAKWVLNLLKFDSETVVTAGHNKNSAEVIANSLASPHGSNTVTDLINKINNNEMPESTKIIVVDEIPALLGVNRAEQNNDLRSLVEALTKFTQSQQAKGIEVKILFMGDPNQITKSAGKTSLELYYSSDLPGLKNITVVPPLTIRYRSDNSSIINVQDSFIDKREEVQGVTGAINVDPSTVKNTDSVIIGSYVEVGNSNLLDILANQIKNYKGDKVRTRAIVVADDAAVEKYTKKVVEKFGQDFIDSKKIEIVTYENVQGRTLDEVYVDIVFNAKKLDHKKSNSALYTATSRASEFLYLANIKDGATVSDPGMESSVKTNKESIINSFDVHTAEVERQLSVYKSLKTSSSTTTKEEEETEEEIKEETETPEESKTEEEKLKDEERELNDLENDSETIIQEEYTEEEVEDQENKAKEEAEEAAEESKEEEITQVEAIITPLEDEVDSKELEKEIDSKEEANEMTLIEVSSSSFYPIEFGGDTNYFPGLSDMLNEGPVSAQIIGITKMVKGQPKNYVVLAYPKDNNEFVILAYLTENEVNQGNFMAKVNFQEATIEDRKLNIVSLPSAPLLKVDVTISTESHNMKYVHDNDSFEPLVNWKTVVKRWIDSLNKNGRGADDNAHRVEVKNEDEIMNSVRVHVFTQKDLEKKMKNIQRGKRGTFKGRETFLRSVLGRPFLFLRDVKRTTVKQNTDTFTSGNGSDHLISLRPRKLNKNKHGRFIQPVVEFLNEAKVLEGLLADAGIDLKLGSFRFSRLVVEASTYMYKVNNGIPLGKDSVAINRNFSKLKKYLNIDANTNSLEGVDAKVMQIIESATRLDVHVHGEFENRRKDKNGIIFRKYEGKAQEAFDTIAKSNLFYITKTGKIIFLRDTRRYGKGNEEKIAGRSLLGNTSLEANATTQWDYTSGTLKSINKFLERYYGKEKAREILKTQKVTKNLSGDPNKNRWVMNTEELDEIFNLNYDEKGDSNANSEFGLRVPIQIKEVNRKLLGAAQITPANNNVLENNFLEDHFETSFEEVKPPKIVINLGDPKKNKAKADPIKPVTPISPKPNKPKTVKESTTTTIGTQIAELEAQKQEELDQYSYDIVERVEDYEVVNGNGDTLFVQIRHKKDGSKEVLIDTKKNKYGNVAKQGAVIADTFHEDIYMKVTKIGERTGKEANLAGRENKINAKYDAKIAELNAPQSIQEETVQEEEIINIFNENPELSKIGTVEEYSQYLDTIFPNSKVKDIVYHAGSIGKFPESVNEKEYNILLDKEKKGLLSDNTAIGKYSPHNSEKDVLDQMKQRIEESNIFNNSNIGKSGFQGLYLLGAGFYFGTYEEATDYGEPKPYLINIENPNYTSEYTEKANFKSQDSNGALIYPNKDQGKDGVINDAQGSQEFSVFDNNQIHYIGSKEDITGFKEFIKTNSVPESKLNQAELPPTDIAEDTDFFNLPDEEGSDLFKMEAKFDPGQELSTAETAKLIRQYNPKTFRQMIMQFLNRLRGRTTAEKDIYTLLDEAEMAWLSGGVNWGAYKAGLTYLLKSGKGGSYSKALAHEEFHRITQSILNTQQVEKLYALARAAHPALNSMPRVETEEWLARRFMEYADARRTNKSIGTYITEVFQRILRSINLISKDFNTIEEMFDKAYMGHFAYGVTLNTDPTDLYLMRNPYARKLFNENIQKYNVAKELVLKSIRRHYDRKELALFTNKSEEEVISYSFRESINKAHGHLIYMKNKYEQANKYFKKLSEETADPVLKEQYLRKSESHLANAKLYSLVANREVYNFLIQSLYNNNKLKSRHTDYELGKGEDPDMPFDEDTSRSLSDEISSRDNFNTKKDTTSEIKLAFGNVWTSKKTIGGNVIPSKLISFEKAYKLSMDILKEIGVEVGEEEILEKLQDFKEMYKMDLEAVAVVEFLMSKFKKSAVPLNRRISFRSEGVILIDNRTEEASLAEPLDDLDTNQADNIADVVVIRNTLVKIEETGEEIRKDTPQFLTLLAKAQGFTIAEISNEYENHKARELVRDIAVTFMSLEDRNPLIGIREWKEGSIVHKYIQANSTNIREVYVSEVREALAQFYLKTMTLREKQIEYNEEQRRKGEPEIPVTSLPDLTKMLEDLEEKQIKNSESGKSKDNLTNKKVILSQIFNKIKFGNKKLVDEIPDGRKVHVLFESLNILFTRMNTQIGEREGQHKNIYDFVAEETKFIMDLSGLVSDKDMFLASSTYISGDGNRIGIMKKSSFAGLLLNNLFNKVTNNKFFNNGLNKDFMSLNAFKNGDNVIHQMGDHDTTKFKGVDNSAVIYKRETPGKWLTRNFVYQFTSSITRKNEKGKKYFQQLWTISNKPTMRNVEVNFLNDKNIRKILLNMVKQEKLRKPKNSNRAFAALKHYTPEKSYLNNLGTVGRLSDEQAVEHLLKYFKEESEKLYEDMKNEFFYFPDNMGEVYKAITGENPTKAFEEIMTDRSKKKRRQDALANLDLSEDAFANLSEEKQEEIEAQIKELSKEYYEKNNEELKLIILPVLESFFSNWYINSHQLNQLVIQDQAFFKTGAETDDITKRLSIAFGPGTQGRIGKFFMKEKFKVVIMEDFEFKMGKQPNVQAENEDTLHESTDAQAYITPAYLRQIQKGWGKNSNSDMVLKPVYYGVDEHGIPRALKLSVVVLTDDLVARFPDLEALRDKMTAKGKEIDMATFASALKVGGLNDSAITKLYDADGKLLTDGGIPNEFNPDSILTLDSAGLRIQLNPNKTPMGDIANPTQMPYLTIMNEAIIKEANRLLELTKKRMELGSRKVDRMYKLNNGIPTQGSKSAIWKEVKEALSTMPGAEAEYSLSTIQGISQNLPVLVNKAIQVLGSSINRNTSGFRLKGGKLVLQSAWGTDFITDKDGKRVGSELKWRDKNGFTEVYVSEEFANLLGLKPGDLIMEKALSSVGFRIPSTGLHSAIVMKLKGTYPSPKGTKTNIIIAPKEIVHVQGSDYDVDSLMFMRRNQWKDVVPTSSGSFNLDEIIYNVAPSLYEQFDLNKLPEDIINYQTFENTDKDLVPENYQGKSLRMYLEKVIEEGDNNLSNLKIKFKNSDKETRKSILNQIKELSNNLETIENILIASTENELIDQYITILTHDTSKEYMELPITMNYLKGKQLEKGLSESALDVVAQLMGAGYKEGQFSLEEFKKERDKVLYPNKDISNIRDHREIHNSTFSGDSLTGSSANAAKMLSYTFMSGNALEVDEEGLVTKRQVVKVKPELSISFNGGTYDSLQHKEQGVNEEGNLVNELFVRKGGEKSKPYTIWESLDSLINASIDNVKEQIINLINLNGVTGNSYFAGIGLGIPLNSMVRLMRQPVLMKLAFENSSVKEDTLNQERNKLINIYATKFFEKDITEEQKEKAIEELKENSEVTDEKLMSAALEFNESKSFEELSEEALLTQIRTINTYKKLNTLGDTLFIGSQQLLIIKQIPSEYAVAKDLLESIDQETVNTGNITVDSLLQVELERQVMEKVKEVNDLIKEGKTTEANELLQAYTDEIKNSEDPETIQTLQVLKKDIKNKKELIIKQNKIEEYIRVLRGEELNYVPSSKWPFLNSNMMNVPNYKEAYRNTLKFITLVEHNYWKHSHSVTNFAIDLVKNKFNIKPFGKDGFYKLAETFKNDLITYLTSSLELKNDNFSYSFAIDPKSGITDQGEMEGFKLWTYELVEDIKKLKLAGLAANEENEFLNRLMFKYDWKSREYKLMFTAHKTKDDGLFQFLKTEFTNLGTEGWRNLQNENNLYETKITNGTISDIQLRLLKYLAITKGLSFGSVNYTEIISEELLKMFSTELESKLAEHNSIDDYSLINENLSNIKDVFSLQYARNNPSILPSLNPSSSSVIMKEKKEYGTDVVDGITYNYDLAVRNSKSEFVAFKKDSNSLYQKIATIDTGENGKVTYYRNVGKFNFNTRYSNQNNNPNSLYDKTRVVTAENLILNSQYLKSGIFIFPEKVEQIPLKEGQVVFLRNSDDTGLETMKSYRVEKVRENGQHVFKYLEDITPYVTPVKTEIKNFTNNSNNANSLNSNTLLTVEEKNKIKNKNSVGLKLSEILKRLNFDRNDFRYDTLQSMLEIEDSTIYIVSGFEKESELGKSNSNITVITANEKINNDKLIHILTHELAHRHTTILTQNKNNLTGKKLEIINALTALYEEVKIDPNFSNEYGVINFDEFIAEGLSNPDFRSKLGQKSINKSFFTRFKNLLTELWQLIFNLDSVTALTLFDSFSETLIINSSNASRELKEFRIAFDSLPENLKNLDLFAYYKADINLEFVGDPKFSPNESYERWRTMKLDSAILRFEEEKKEDKNNNDARSIGKKIIDELLEKEIEQIDNKETGESYYTDNTGTKYKRLTEYIRDTFAPYSSSYKSLEHFITFMEFKRSGKSEKDVLKVTENQVEVEYTFEDRIKFHAQRSNKNKAEGKLAHALFEYFLTDKNDTVRLAEIQSRINEYQEDEFDEKGNLVREGVKLKKFDWLQQNRTKILEKSGIFYDPSANEKDYDFKYIDEIMPEMMLVMKELGIGTTLDGFIQHKSGQLSIIDWKTQGLLSDQGTADFMSYGKTYDVRKTKLDKAKLEVVLRALMIKNMQPDAKFNILSVNWLNEKSLVRNYPIDLQPYLSMIKDQLEATNKETFDMFNEKGLFDANNYYGEIVLSAVEEKIAPEIDENTSNTEAIEIIDSKLEALQSAHTPGDIARNAHLKSTLDYLVNMRAKYTYGKYDVENDSDDMTGLEKALIELKDTRNKLAQMFTQKFLKGKNSARVQKNKDWDEHDDYFRKVLSDYYSTKGLKGLSTYALFKPLGSLGLETISTKELFGFMWEKHSDGRIGQFRNTKDTYLPEGATERVALTENQKAYRDFYVARIDMRYNEVRNQTLIDENGNVVTKSKLQQMPELDELFMPRTAITSYEMREQYPLLSRDRWNQYWKQKLSNFTVENFQGDSKVGLPIRNMPALGSQVIEYEEHSFDTAKAFKAFTNNMAEKYYLDSAVTLGNSLVAYMRTAQDKQGGIKYKNLTNWLENMIKLHLENESKDGNFHYSRKVQKVPKFVQNFLGFPEEIHVDGWRIAKMLKWWTSLGAMGLKLIPATFNGALIITTNHLKAATNSIAKNFFGVPKEELAFTLSDMIKADLMWMDYLKDWIRGKGRENKLWNLSRKLNFLPDNYDYSVTDKDSLYHPKSIFSATDITPYFFYFHSMFENYGANTLLAAMAQKTKYEFTHVENGTKKIATMYEMYDNNGNFDTQWMRGYEPDSKGNLTPVHGFTQMEIDSMKSASSKLHGSYRQEERLTMELTVLGQFMTQFRKYLPNLIKENWRRNRLDPYTGYMKQISTTEGTFDENGKVIIPAGMNIYEWEAQMHEGRMQVALGVIGLAPLWARKDETSNVSYKWQNLTGDRRAAFINVMATGSIMLIAAFLFAGWDDEDKNKYWFKRTRKLMEDITLGVNPMDILRPLEKTAAAGSKLIEIIDALTLFATEGIQGKVDSKGWKKGVYPFARTLPLWAGINQYNQIIKEWDEDYILEIPTTNR